MWAHAIDTLLAALGVYPFAASVCIVFNPFYEMRPRLIKPVQVKQLHKVAAACLDSCQVHQVTFRWGPESVVHSFSKRRMGLVLEVGARFAFCVPVSTLRKHNNSSQSMPTTSSPVYTASNFTMAGIGLNHMAGNRSAAYSGEHLSTGRSERLSLMPTSPSGGLDLTALMQSMISKHNHEATMEEARRIKEAECYVRARVSQWMPAEENNFLLQGKAHCLSGGGSVTLTTERFLVPEALFHADETLLGIMASSPKKIMQVVSH